VSRTRRLSLGAAMASIHEDKADFRLFSRPPQFESVRSEVGDYDSFRDSCASDA
jgi:hypothetical protein